MRTNHIAVLLVAAALSMTPVFAQEESRPPLFSSELPRWSAGAFLNLAIGGADFTVAPGLTASLRDLQVGLHGCAADGAVQAAAMADYFLFNEPLAGLPISWFAGPGAYVAAGADFDAYLEVGAGLRGVLGIRTLVAGRLEAFAAAVPSFGLTRADDLSTRNWSFGVELGMRYAIPRKAGLSLELSRPEGDWTPDGDGLNDRLGLSAKALGEYPIRSWTLEVFNPAGQPFYARTVQGPLPPLIDWDGVGDNGEKVASMRDYRYALTAVDRMGTAAAVADLAIPVGIVLNRRGDDFVLDLTGFIFVPDSPRLATDAASEKENARLLASLKACLDRMGQYRLTIVGHAVNVSGTEAEEVSLAALSTARAETVKAELKKLGYDVAEVSTAGKGGTQPIVPHTDTVNRWKNRRVEFIMTPKGTAE